MGKRALLVLFLLVGLWLLAFAGPEDRHALRIVQSGGAWLVRVVTALIVIAVVLAALRLLVQLLRAELHERRIRRIRKTPLQDLGPASVIVPVFNEAADIAATVRSLVGNDYPKLEVIVVDDGSTDGTGDLVEALGLPGVFVLRQVNAGKPAALHAGIRYAQHDLLVVVDGGTVVEKDTIGRLLQQLRDPAVGAVAGNVKVANRDGLLGRWQHLEFVIGFILDHRVFDIGRCTPTVPGAVGAFRRSALRDVDGISARPLAEDMDFTMAVRTGRRVVYEPAAIAWIEEPALLRQRYRWRYGTMRETWNQVVGHATVMVLRGGRQRRNRRDAASASDGETTPPEPPDVPLLSTGYFEPARSGTDARATNRTAIRNQRADTTSPASASPMPRDRPRKPSSAEQRYGEPERPAGRANTRWPTK